MELVFTFKCEFIHFHHIRHLLGFFLLKLLTLLCFTLSSTLHLLLNLVALDGCAKCFVLSDTFSFYYRLERNIYSWFCENILNWKLNFVTVLLLSLYQMSHLFQWDS